MGQAEYRPNRRLLQQIEKYLINKLTLVGFAVRDQAVILLSQQGNVHGSTPSLPGQPPAVVTGTLRSSITSVLNSRNLEVWVGVDAGSPANKYAAALEFGTSRIAPRPYLRPAMQLSKKKIIRILTK